MIKTYHKRPKSINELEKNLQEMDKTKLSIIIMQLVNGEITVEDYIMQTNIDIEDLIYFARKEKYSLDIIRNLCSYRREYKVFHKPFDRDKYLEATIIMVDGKEVRPTKKDVDDCIEYLERNGHIICDISVRKTISEYLRGKIDLTKNKEKGLRDNIKVKVDSLNNNKQTGNQDTGNIDNSNDDHIK